MVTLHGFSSSNYYNIVKHVLTYKEIPFEEHLIYGGTDDEWLSISPVGKVPALTTEAGTHLSETTVICDYLEEVYPERPLYPADAESRARVRQIMKVAELYLELSSRRLIAYAFGAAEVPEAVSNDVRHVSTRGIQAMRRLCRFSPHIAGSEFTMADIYLLYVNAVVSGIGARILDWDIMGEIPGMQDWLKGMREGEIARAIEADRKANEPDFMAYIQKYMAQQA